MEPLTAFAGGLALGALLGFLVRWVVTPHSTVESETTKIVAHMGAWVKDEGRVLTSVGFAHLGDFKEYPEGDPQEVIVQRRKPSDTWKIVQILE